MKFKLFIVVMGVSAQLWAESSIAKAIEGITHSGELRFGAIRTKDETGEKRTTYSMGGRFSLESRPIEGINLVGTFFTTNHLFNKSEEEMFLSSEGRDYSIVGEAYLQLKTAKTTIKAGRQIVDTPFADSDDIGMVPNSFEGYTLINEGLESTQLILGLLDKWAGVDTPTPEKFTTIQEGSEDSLFTAGFVYSGWRDTILQFWHYKLDGANFNYGELTYEKSTFNMGFQYSDQDNDNSAYGLSIGGEVDGLNLGFAYNKVDGVVSNGFGGGPFFTSSEEHTIADTPDQEAFRYSVEYGKGDLSWGLSHTEFDKGENETDYLLSYRINRNHTLDLIYSEMYDDGNMVRFFANYKF